MIAIIGAGLSGLLTAYRLEKAGIPYYILEGRNRVGGRILTIEGDDSIPTEMGATWFGNQHQNLQSLLKELDIDRFEQKMDGKVYFQPFSTSPAQALQIPSQESSYRIAGGSSNLIQTLYRKIDKAKVLLNQRVSKVEFVDGQFEICANNTFKANQIVLALPPKLWSKTIEFSPQLPIDLLEIASNTHTWMEESIKVGFTYKQPFWETENRPSTLFSNTGPITEFYDHANMERSKYALCGFANPALSQLDYNSRKTSIESQLKNVFGNSALQYSEYREYMWSKDKFTYIRSNDSLTPHQNNGHPLFRKDLFNGKLLISSTEASAQYSGYMEGAVYMGNYIADRLMATNETES